MISPLGFEGSNDQGAANDDLMGMDITTELGVTEDDVHSLSGAVLGDEGGGGGLGRQVSASDNSSSAPATSAEAPALTGRLPMRIYLTCDDKTFTPYQVLVRKQIEFFETLPVDLDVVQGRNKPIQLGQVGIRCMHCRSIYPVSKRGRGAVYYPSTLQGLYQAAQNMAKHLHECDLVPLQVRNDLANMSSEAAKSSGGKEAWASRAIALGVYQDDHGLRFEKTVDSREHSSAHAHHEVHG